MSNIPIFLTSDNNYAPFVATTMASILSNTKSYIDFYILDGGIKEDNKERINSLKKNFNNFHLEFLKTNVNEFFRSFKISGHLNLTTYSRLLISILKPTLSKVLYLDTDIIVLDDINSLYQINLDKYALGAAWHPSRILYNNDTKVPLELSNEHKYFNAGVLLIDIQKWKKNNVIENLFLIQKKYNNNILHADETLLNKYFDANYKIFDTVWNYTDYDVVNRPNCVVKLRHFASALKPWNANYFFAEGRVYKTPFFDDFWKYVRMTEFECQIRDMYEKEINKNAFTKRMSIIANRQG